MGTLKDRCNKGLAELEREESTEVITPDDRTVIHCRTLEIEWDPVKVLIPADLPELAGTGLSEEERRKETKLIKIVAATYWFIGLTNKGHVLKSDKLNDEASTVTWDYVRKSARKLLYLYSKNDTQLPNFSEIDKVKQHPTFHTTIGDDGEERPPEVELSLDTMLITDVSHIFLISSGFPI